MDVKTIEKLVIIGSGPAGLTAALYAARSHLEPLVFEGDTPGGQLTGTTAVENWPGDISVLGPQLMRTMREHAQHFGTRLLFQEIIDIDITQRPFIVTTDKHEKILAYAIIIATGATPRRLHVPGEDTYWGRGITSCAVCDGAFYTDKPILVVGGGDSAMEAASFMTHFTKKITVVHILDKLTASPAMQDKVLKYPFINVIYHSTITAFDGNGQHVTQATIMNKQTGIQQVLPVNAAFIAIGMHPNTGLVKGKLELDDWGYIVQKLHTQTSVPGIFAAGDVVDYRYRQAITSASSGCMAALDAEEYLKNIID